MHDPMSKKLPIKSPNFTNRITELKDPVHHGKLAEKHYKEVKRTQCILDYNIAVDNLSELCDKIMLANEEQEDLEKAFEKAQNQMKNTLANVQKDIDHMKKSMGGCYDQMLLSKAKMQLLGVSASELSKLKPISQGTQAIAGGSGATGTSTDSAIVVDIDTSKTKQLVTIPDDENDEAIKHLLASEGITEEVTLPQNTASATFTTPQNVTPAVTFTPQNMTQASFTPQNVAPGFTPQNVAPGVFTQQNVTQVTPQNVVLGSGTVQKVVTPILPAGCISAPFPSAVNTGQPTVINLEIETFKIPDGFKKTKYEDTLERTDLKPIAGQKAPKRFFCLRCMEKEVYTGYTKRNDLAKHLEGCGTTKEKKHKCTHGDCQRSFIRIDNLKQHVAKEHTKVFLYKCKKCDKGFYTSPDATNHRKQCYPVPPNPSHTNEEQEDDEKDKDKDNPGDVDDDV